MISERLKTPAQRIAFLSLCLSLIFFTFQAAQGNLDAINRTPQMVSKLALNEILGNRQYFAFKYGENALREVMKYESRKLTLDETLVYLNIAWIIASFALTLCSTS